MAHYNSGPITCRCCKSEFIVTGTEKEYQIRRNPRWTVPEHCRRCLKALQTLGPAEDENEEMQDRIRTS